MSPPRRVLAVCEPTHAGAAQVTVGLADGLRAFGYATTVCTPPGELAQWCAAAGVPVLELPFARRDAAAYPRAARTVADTLRRGDWSIVHAHSSFSGALVRGLAPRDRPPLVFQPHAWSFQAVSGAPRAVALAVERGLARRTDLLICVSAEELRVGEAAGVRARRSVVVPNGVAFAAPAPVRDTPGPRPTIGVVARLTHQKGVDVLLRAIADPGWPAGAEVEIAGDGPLEATLRALAGSLGIADRVRFLGRLPDVAPLLERWDLYVSPARYEGASLALLEAVSAGLPVVCTAVAGVAGLTDPRRPAVAIEDPPALAAAVAAALGDWPTTLAAATAVREHARRRFSLDAQLAATAAAYASLPAAG